MPGLVAGLLSCWHQWLGKHNSNIWNLILGCLMWIVWLEQNHRTFENMEKMLDELKVICQRSLFEWSRCWGFTDSLSLLEFMFSLRLTFWFPSFVLLFVSSVSSCSSSWTTCTIHFLLINNSSLITYQKKLIQIVLLWWMLIIFYWNICNVLLKL